MKRTIYRRARAQGRFAVAVALAAATCLLGCSVTGGRGRGAVTERTVDGFTITERSRPAMGGRSDFAAAAQAMDEEAWERAISLLREVTESNPGFAAPQINLAVAYREAGRFEEAVEALTAALDANPNHPVAHNELGITYRRQGRFEEARNAYQAALDLQPTFHPARKNLAILCDLFLADLECALAHYRLYLEADPADPNVAIWIADLESRGAP